MEKLIVFLIIALCGVWFGRRLFKQFRAAAKKNQEMSCGCGCSGCDTPQRTINSTCGSSDNTNKKEKK